MPGGPSGEQGRPAWYLPVGEMLGRARAEAIHSTFSHTVRRVGRRLRERLEGRRPDVAVCLSVRTTAAPAFVFGCVGVAFLVSVYSLP